jgi:glycosyltransferase involved in cell wall biosynthesis
MKLSGLVLTRNCVVNDYAYIQAIQSLLPVCDEVVVSDSDSTDGTLEVLNAWAAEEPKIRVVNYPWPDPKGEMGWFVKWINHGRSHVKAPMMLQLDADEVLSDEPSTKAAIELTVSIRGAIAFDRINFVRDAHSVIPEGECCGRWVVRLGPSHLHWVSDEPHKPGEVPLLDMAHLEHGAKIFHLGFLRKREAFFRKAQVVGTAFFNEYDQRLKRSELSGDHAFSEFPWWNRLTVYHGYFPLSVRAWLKERGYKI